MMVGQGVSAGGKVASGFGSIPFNHTFSFPPKARLSEREYGRFGSYFDYTIEKGKPLMVNYRLWLREGLMQPQEVVALSNNFVEPVKVTVHEP